MPRKKGWFRAKRKAEEQRAVQAIGNYDHEYCSLPKRSTCDSEPHILDHDYYTKESVDLNDTSELFSVHSHVYRKSENGETDMIYDDTEVAETVDVTFDHFDNMYYELTKVVQSPYIITKCGDSIKIIEMYDSAMKLCIVIKKDLTIHLYVHNRLVPKGNSVFEGIIDGNLDVSILMKFLNRLKTSHVCVGNPEEQFVKLLPEGSGLSVKGDGVIAYLEQDFGAKRKDGIYYSSIRSIDCDFILYTKGERCLHCSRTRAVLRDREYRRKEKELRPQKSYLHSKSSHSQMDRNQLLLKLNEQKNVIKDLQKENARLMRQVDKYIRDDGIKMDKERSLEFSDLMSSCESEVMKAFPDSNCFQRLFWEQQMKEAKSGKCGMRWHPMIVRWCLYLRQTSNKCYETLRKSGFLKLPSSRTLFDYSHYIKSVNGFSPEVFQMLKNEATKNGMYKEEWKLWVGLLFDEIHVKADLVYDKHSGELVGYVDLDSVGNQILQMQHQLEQSHQNLAKSMLVLMVRGLCGNLTFPLAGFATDSIKADFLYPIVWKTILYLERFVKLKVLCVTCDGASPNRKFFNLHKGDDDTTYYSINPHDRSRKIFFISDVPHLLKTTRNCISNSFWHKNSRRLWKDGKDISWRHIIRLYEEHCENSLYTPCPKLTHSHVHLTAFSVMKVNLAAQILSSTVSSALEMLYGSAVSETVSLLSSMDKFFDCLNVRSLYEGKMKRNDNLTPYTSVDDPRLFWLQDSFLGYLNDWEKSVMERPGNIPLSEKNKMLLSIQTRIGLNITVKSIVQCIKVLLNSGAPFVLTHAFNQDPLEQHFGHYRHKGGGNNNPTVFEVRHTINQLRTVGAEGLVPRNGNITIGKQVQRTIDNTPLPRRRDKHE